MADDADRADEKVEAYIRAAVAAARQSPFADLAPCGRCWWCGDPVDAGRTHCRPSDNDCEAMHLQSRRFNRGKTT